MRVSLASARVAAQAQKPGGCGPLDADFEVNLPVVPLYCPFLVLILRYF